MGEQLIYGNNYPPVVDPSPEPLSLDERVALLEEDVKLLKALHPEVS